MMHQNLFFLGHFILLPIEYDTLVEYHTVMHSYVTIINKLMAAEYVFGIVTRYAVVAFLALVWE